MKIRIHVIADKVVEAPEFLRPYIVGEKFWDEMSDEEDLKYSYWFAELAEKENVIDDWEWELAED